ncbi:MAG: Smr/MutS family protein [Methyloligellaceae bacterium]
MPRKPRDRGLEPDGEPHLDAEDAALWAQIARTTAPLSRGRNRVTLRSADPALRAREERAAQARKPSTGSAAAKPPVESRPVQAGPPPLNRYDRREARALSRGRMEPEARLDLHGMRQREAHGALKRFLARARERGCRHVLVITGKGSGRANLRGEGRFTAGGEDAGVLRRSVPLWLEEADIRQWIVSYTTAAPRHGGEGALYVRLRRADAPRGPAARG